MSVSNLSTMTDAATLVAHGLRPRQRPLRDAGYAELVRRFRTDEDFAAAVRAVAVGLDLVVLDCDERHGLVVASTEDSVFAMSVTDYARRTAQQKASERVLHALAHLGVATLAYPRPADLANPAYVGRVTAVGVEAFVREAAARLRDQAVERGDNPDAPTDRPDLQAAWAAWDTRAATPSSADGRLVSSSTLGMVNKALGVLVEQGMLVQTGKETPVVYRTTSRYQVQVREAGRRMFEELLALGITEVTDGTGSLVPMSWSAADVAAL